MICAGNWKMNKSPAETREFIAELKAALKDEDAANVILLVPALCLEAAVQAAAGTKMQVGAQNCHWQDSGAFTGENSPRVMHDMGAKFCLVGHSERRQLFKEDDEVVAAKLKAVQTCGLTPILCIGEDLKEREANKTADVLRRQLQAALSGLDDTKPYWIAYEPVWAIGTGKVATPEQVREAHEVIRTWLKRYVEGRADVPILYGGSVKPGNAGELAKHPNVDGFLIGGASLELDSFLGILRA